MLNFSMIFKKPSLIYLIKSRLLENPLGIFKPTCKGVLSIEFPNTQKLPSKFFTSYFPLIILWHIQLCIYKAGLTWSLVALNLLFNLENQRVSAFTWWKFWQVTYSVPGISCSLFASSGENFAEYFRNSLWLYSYNQIFLVNLLKSTSKATPQSYFLYQLSCHWSWPAQSCECLH